MTVFRTHILVSLQLVSNQTNYPGMETTSARSEEIKLYIYRRNDYNREDNEIYAYANVVV